MNATDKYNQEVAIPTAMNFDTRLNGTSRDALANLYCIQSWNEPEFMNVDFLIIYLSKRVSKARILRAVKQLVITKYITLDANKNITIL